MTPKEWKWVIALVSHVAEHNYQRGYADADEKTPRAEKFKLSKGDEMRLKTELEKYLKKS